MFRVGDVQIAAPVFLAPMSGVTDEPFRMTASEQGAGLVVSEMVASEELVNARPDMLRRALGAAGPGRAGSGSGWFRTWDSG